MVTNSSSAVRRQYDRESQVLIVDDDSTLLKFFKIHLNKFFSKVLVVEDGKEALLALEEKGVDLIVSDIRMPRLGGLELFAKVRKNHPDVPFLLFSGEPLSTEQQAQVNSSDGFLMKGFSIDELNTFIEGGIDLRYVFREISPLLKDPKKIREALKASPKDLTKYVAKNDQQKFLEIVEKLPKPRLKFG